MPQSVTALKEDRSDSSNGPVPARTLHEGDLPAGSAPHAGPPPDFTASPLNEKYTFGSFVVASCNRFAHAAAQAVADAPGKTYNPLYLYGGVGLGKTHLIQATGHAIKTANPNLHVSYLSLERFMNELINAIRYGYDKTQLFRERYRSIDVLLIDDVQFIAGKERTQEEFFHTFNALYDSQKQIVLTSDCPPREIPEIEERLHSRFEWGLIADIEPPDLETKVAILNRKAEGQGVYLPDDVALFLAGNSKHNIRELEGSLIRVLAMASLRGVPLSKNLAQEAMRSVSRVSEETPISITRIQKAVADYYKISVDSLKSRSNIGNVLVPRQVAMYLCKRLTKKSYPEIARQFGGKHHTTVMHSVEKIDKLLGSDRELDALVKRIISSIGA
jgi:chromosomal replication initiator protein